MFMPGFYVTLTRTGYMECSVPENILQSIKTEIDDIIKSDFTLTNDVWLNTSYSEATSLVISHSTHFACDKGYDLLHIKHFHVFSSVAFLE